METRIERVDPQDLSLAEVNARYMRHEEFMRLVDNVKRDGKLTSTPFCCEEEGRLLVLSGNHRVKAAIAAGLSEIDVMVTSDPLTQAQRYAIQLSHNAIVGKDDPAILKEIYDAIDDAEWKEYTGLDDATLELLEKVEAMAMSEANLDYRLISISFLPHELERVREVIDEVRKEAPGKEVWLARADAYDRLLDDLEAAGSAHGIKNTATSLDIILDVFEAHQDDLAEGWVEEDKNRWVPLVSIFGNDKVPVEAAKVLKQALDRAVGQGIVGPRNLWQLLEYMAADFLAS
ncbi:MAG: ParB N-terminal domain-containing protein [Actinomycetota bacterium]